MRIGASQAGPFSDIKHEGSSTPFQEQLLG